MSWHYWILWGVIALMGCCIIYLDNKFVRCINAIHFNLEKTAERCLEMQDEIETINRKIDNDDNKTHNGGE